MLSSNCECMTSFWTQTNPQGTFYFHANVNKLHLTVATTISTTLARTPDEYPRSCSSVFQLESTSEDTHCTCSKDGPKLQVSTKWSGQRMHNKLRLLWVMSTVNEYTRRCHRVMLCYDITICWCFCLGWFSSCFPRERQKRCRSQTPRHDSQNSQIWWDLRFHGSVRRKCLKILQKLGLQSDDLL